MNYYALGNAVYKGDFETVCVVAPVWLLKPIANMMAQVIAKSLNDLEMDSADVLRGSLD